MLTSCALKCNFCKSSNDSCSRTEAKEKKKKNEKKKRNVRITIKGEEVLRYTLPNFFPDFVPDDDFLSSSVPIEELGKDSTAKETIGGDDDGSGGRSGSIYVWSPFGHRGTRAKTSSSSSSTQTTEKKTTRDILNEKMDQADRADQSLVSKMLIFSTVFIYSIGLVLSVHRGFVDLGEPAMMVTERDEVAAFLRE
jgi:hypothetical protein